MADGFGRVVEFVGNHPAAIFATILGVIVLVAFFLITDTGRDLWELLIEHPELFLLIALMLSAPLAVWLWMIRPKSTDKERLDPGETIRKFKLTVMGRKYKISHYDYTPPWVCKYSNETIFHNVYLVVPGSYKRTSISICDSRRDNPGKFLRDHMGVLTRQQCIEYDKKAYSFEEEARIAGQFESRLEGFRKDSENKQAQKEIYGSSG